MVALGQEAQIGKSELGHLMPPELTWKLHIGHCGEDSRLQSVPGQIPYESF